MKKHKSRHSLLRAIKRSLLKKLFYGHPTYNYVTEADIRRTMNTFIENESSKGHSWKRLTKSCKPTIGGDYLVVWVLDDGQYPVTEQMEYSWMQDKWTDKRSERETVVSKDKILFWDYLPKPPKNINPALWMIGFEINE